MKAGDAIRIAGAAAVAGDLSTLIDHAAAIEETDIRSAVLFINDAAMLPLVSAREFGLCFVPTALKDLLQSANGVFATAGDPRGAFAAVADALHRLRPLGKSSNAKIDPQAAVHPSAVIGEGAEIGSGAVIGPNVVVGPGVVIGARTVVAENASVWCALIGEACRIGVASAVGGPGFGFAVGPSGLARVPQLGRVIIEDHVELGAHVCVDRGALGDTFIGAGTKIDNLVQIGHNVRIGRACILAAQVGVSGSSVLNDRVQCGGQAGIADHLTIGEDARIAAKAGVICDIPAGETWGGYPARQRMVWLREMASLARAAARKKKAGDDGD